MCGHSSPASLWRAAPLCVGTDEKYLHISDTLVEHQLVIRACVLLVTRWWLLPCFGYPSEDPRPIGVR